MVTPVILFPQEVCDNGVDDDGDSLIDLNDEDCSCSLNYSLIPNPSFEDSLCCPTSVTQTSCTNLWEQASEGTSDYFHMCGLLNGISSPSPPMPIPDGEAFVGFLNGGLSASTKEYIGICLMPDTFIIDNTSYVVEFYIGFGVERDLDFYSASSDSPVEICIYGNPNCSNLPFEGIKCPLLSPTPDWRLLGCVEVAGEDEWVKTSIEFTAPEQIEAIAIGPNCEDAPFGEDLTYYFIDHITSFEAATAPIISIVSGLPCLENTTLGIPNLENVSYQWYHDGVAIIDAISTTYEVPPGSESEGNYQIVLTDSSGCFTTTPFEYLLEGYPVADLGADTVLCKNNILVLGENNVGDSFLWNTGETTSSIVIENNGLYSVTVSNECGEDYDEVYALTDEDHLNCYFEFPNAFTPDGDGINDGFGVLTDCCLTRYSLQVFSRWGEKVFESSSVDTTWDGTYKGKPAPSDAYSWLVIYEISHGAERTAKKAGGEVVLIR